MKKRVRALIDAKVETSTSIIKHLIILVILEKGKKQKFSSI